MYASYFGLAQEPFSIAPDPRYLFMSERHREALAHLLYGVGGGGGFVLLSGEIGAGKTTVCRCFLEQVPRRCNVAYIFNPKLTVTELLKSVCDEFGIQVAHLGDGGATAKDYVDALNEFLLRTHAVGQNSVLVIDEAQNLSPDVLEQLRLLTNLETNDRKLLQIILIGQPELRAMLARPELEQLAQRVIARFHLDALSEGETAQYVRHRLAVAGMSHAIPFDAGALRRIHRLARGVPRRINLLADRALLGAYAIGKTSVDRRIIDRSAREVFGGQAALPRRRLVRLALGAAGGMAVAAAAAFVVLGGVRPVAAPPPARAASAAVAVAAASAPASAPGPLGTPELKARMAAFARSEDDAWRALAPRWGLPAADDDPCRAAAQQQVMCFKTSSTTLALIRQLARPGFLTLRDGDSVLGYAVLTGLSDDRAMLLVDGSPQPVALGALAQFWRGDFATYWRAPPVNAMRIDGGDTGPAAQWLEKRLAALPGVEGDAPLKARIQSFQLAHGLPPDGLAGPMTFMQLNRATGVDEPRLTIASGGGPSIHESGK